MTRDAPDLGEIAGKHGIPTAHASYGDLLADDGVDAVYVPLPNGLHAEWALRDRPR